MKKSTWIRMCGLIAFAMVLMQMPLYGQKKLIVNQLKCEQQENPIGIDTPTPRFSWQLWAVDRGIDQTAYRIIVADSPEAIGRGEGTIWDSKKVVSEESLLVSYAGKPLEAGKQYYWSVRVWDNRKAASEWSEPACFSMGLLERADWSGAEWIALEQNIESQIITNGMGGNQPEFGRYSMPLLRKEFETNGKITRATAYICGLGQFDLFLNGEKVGDHFLDPAWTKFDKEVQYVTFDVTDGLRAGGNAIGVMLGNGFFNIPNERYTKFVGSYGAPKMIMKLAIDFEDGTQQVIVSDDSWRADRSPVTFSSIYGGEDYDANLVQQGWNEPGFDDGQWKPVVTGGFDAPLVAQRISPLKVKQKIPTFRKYRNKRGNYLYDLGQNASGIVRLTLRANGKHTVRMYPAEMQTADSLANQRSSGAPYILSYTTLGTGAAESWQPQFTYYGFRYVEVEGAVPVGEPNPEGLPEIIELCGLHTTNSAEPVGTFTCSNPLFNRIYTLIDWAIRSNFSSVFTDCPHREKLGWLEQSHLIGPSIHYGYDMSRAFPKIVNDMATAQHESGMVPTIAPQYTVFSDGFLDTPEWGSAYIIIPWYLYQWYGDKRPIEENYDKMAQYVDYLSSKADGHIVAYGLGDWCDLGPAEPAFAQLTSNGLSATAVYYQDIQIMKQAAELLGKSEDVEKYQELAVAVKKAFNEKFFDKETRKYDRNSQAANAMALYVGLVEPENEEIVLQNLIDDIRSRGNALTAGDVGYRYVVQTLLDRGASDVLFDMNSRYDVPGYGYQLAMGETALAESWQSRDYLSHNHCMLGHLYSWLFAGLGGISQTDTSTAYKEIVIDPQVVGDINSARASFVSPRGLIRSEWKDTPERFELTVEIPATSEALVVLPAETSDRISENGVPVDRVDAVRIERSEKGRTTLRIGSGTYRFVVEK